MKLISFKQGENWEQDAKWEFEIELKGEKRIIILKEKYDWPVIMPDSPIAAVEKFLLNRYKDCCYLAYGEFVI